jgi:hypothetical protein
VENLVACVDEISISVQHADRGSVNALLNEAEKASRAFQCEVILVFCPPQYALRRFGWEDLGFQIGEVGQFENQAWVDAAQKAVFNNTVVFFKRLKQG